MDSSSGDTETSAPPPARLNPAEKTLHSPQLDVLQEEGKSHGASCSRRAHNEASIALESMDYSALRGILQTAIETHPDIRDLVNTIGFQAEGQK